MLGGRFRLGLLAEHQQVLVYGLVRGEFAARDAQVLPSKGSLLGQRTKRCENLGLLQRSGHARVTLNREGCLGKLRMAIKANDKVAERWRPRRLTSWERRNRAFSRQFKPAWTPALRSEQQLYHWPWNGTWKPRLDGIQAILPGSPFSKLRKVLWTQPAQSDSKPYQSPHKAPTKPPQSHILGIDSGVQRHPKA